VELKAEEDGETFDWATVDLISDRNGLRKLLRWIGGAADMRPFRIDLQLAGKKTVLFNRWEKRYREDFSGYTYGFNFEKASTMHAKDCEESTGHHRIISYDLNGLKMVVRFEVDACIPTSASPAPRRGTASIDELTSSLASVAITSSSASVLPSSTVNGLTILKGGATRLQSSIVELTTVSKRRHPSFDWTETYPQLFLSQTPHHFLAIHDRGRFQTVEKRRLGETREFQDVGQDMQRSLQKLRRALQVIQQLVVEHGERGRLTLLCEANGQLRVFERVDQASCLPKDLMDRFVS